MGTTGIPVFKGRTKLTKKKVDGFKELLEMNINDADKAMDVDSCAYYEGFADAMYTVLCQLYDHDPQNREG